jgi:hypothetical protein
MRNGHSASRRQAYGRRMKDLRTRQGRDVVVDLDGPSGWSRGDAWDGPPQMPRPSLRVGPSQSVQTS